MIKVVFLFLLLSATQVSAQSYYPMLGDSNTWYVDNNIQFQRPHVTERFYIEYSSVYYTKGDSTIAGQGYKKFFIHDPYSIYSFSPTGLIGFIREDTTSRKVYYRGIDSIHEIIIYDFSLKTGDSMYVNEAHPPSKLLYSGFLTTGKFKASVSSIFIKSGTRKYLKLSNLESSFYTYNHPDLDWVESLGSLKAPLYFYEPINGIFHPDTSLYSVSVIVTLGCAFRNGVQIYGSDSCDYDKSVIPHSGIPNSGIKNLELNHFICTDQSCTFQSNAFENTGAVFELIDMQGRKLQNLVLPPQQGEIYQCNFIKPLSAGTYIVNIQSGMKYFVQKISVY